MPVWRASQSSNSRHRINRQLKMLKKKALVAVFVLCLESMPISSFCRRSRNKGASHHGHAAWPDLMNPLYRSSRVCPMLMIVILEGAGIMFCGSSGRAPAS
eukprot:1075105-Rhodomonas_salina.3